MVTANLERFHREGHHRRWMALIDHARDVAPALVPVLEEIRRRGAAVDIRPGGQGYRLVPGPDGHWENDEAFRREMEEVIGEHRRALARLLDEFVEQVPLTPPDERTVAEIRVRAAQVPWRVVRDADETRRVCAEAREAGVCGLDTETTPGEDVGALPPAWAKRAPLDPYLGRIRLVQLAVPGRPVAIIDLSAWWARRDAVAAVLRPLQELLAAPSVTKVIYNAAFDLRMLRAALGGRMLRITNVYDPMLAAQLLACGQWPEGKEPFSLEAVVKRTLGLVLDKSAQRSNWAGPLTDDQLRYAALDAAVLLWLRDAQEPLLAGNGLLRAAALEFECAPATADMMYAGMPFDREAWERLREQEEDALAAAVRELEECFAPVAAGQMGLFDRLTVNPDSPQQVLSALRALGAEIEDTRDATLTLLAQQGGPAGRAAEAVLRYRRHAKRLSAFIEPYLEHVHPKTGRIHAEYRQLNPNGVGRFSSSNPNIQQVVRGDAFRRAFRAPEGRALVIADYAAIEMRVMAWLSGDPTLIEVFRSGADPHRRTAALILGKPEISKAERQMVKACFSGDTEILTPHGWIRFDQYDGRTPVAQYSLPEGYVYNPPKARSNRWGLPTGKKPWDGRGGIIEFVQPVDFRKYEGRPLFHQEDRNTDLMLTDDHEVIYIDGNRRPRKRRAVDVENMKYIVAAGRLRANPQLSEIETRLLAMIMADGSLYGIGEVKTVRLGFVKKRKIDRCRMLLQLAGIKYREKTNKEGVTTFTFRSPELWKRIGRFIEIGKALSWTCVGAIDGRVYLEEASYWDGYVDKRHYTSKWRRVYFSTTSKQTAEVMQALAAVSEIPSVLLEERPTRANRHTVYILSYRLGGPPVWRVSWNLVPTGQTDTVYCVQVPSGAILVRRNGKVAVMGNCNFGLIYGMSAGGLQLYASTAYGVKMTKEEAQRFREGFFKAYSGVARWHQRQDRVARKRREIRTASGRARRWASSDMPSTQLYNSPDQGTGADILKRAMARLRPHLMRLGAELVASVHDELVVECNEDRAEEVAEVVKREMEAAGEEFIAPVPVEVEVGVGKTWADKC